VVRVAKLNRVADFRVTGRWYRLRRTITPYLFQAPFLAAFALLFIFPVAYAIWTSLWLDRGLTSAFVGLRNYRLVLTDQQFYAGVERVLVVLAIQVPIMLVLALLFALLLDWPRIRFRGFFRLAFYLPNVIPGAVAALMWGYLYSTRIGPLAQVSPLLNAVHLGSPQPLAESALLPSIMNMLTWLWTGYNMIILYAALKEISPELYDAVDGASEWAVVRYIKIPLLVPALILTGLFSIVGTLQLFNEPAVLSSLTSVPANYTPNYYAYNMAFQFGAFNYSSTIAALLALLTFLLSFLFMRRATRGALTR
jgi:multiple sugar transport system permease protein